METPQPRAVLWPLGLATALSLLGDTTLYTVLPTHTAEAGILLAGVGLLLSANRWIRLPLNAPAGWILERLPRKPVFAAGMILGAISTGLYALDGGFTVLLIARLLWGVAWVGIWVGGNTIILDIAGTKERGKWVGLYQVAFFFGAGGGAVVGGLLTDWFSYHRAMGINAALTVIGVWIALAFLPETRPASRPQHPSQLDGTPTHPTISNHRPQRLEMVSAVALMSVNRLVQEGFLLATLALFMEESLGGSIQLGVVKVGTSTATGLGLGLTTLVAAAAAPLSGWLSDRTGNRWGVAAMALLPGAGGFTFLQTGTPGGLLLGLIGTAAASGASANLSTALIGDLGLHGQHGRRLGGLFTVADLASAAGPLLAFWIAPVIGLTGLYLAAAGLFVIMALVAGFWMRAGQLSASKL